MASKKSLNSNIAIIVAAIACFLVSGGFIFTLGMMGSPVSNRDLIAVINTPVAMLFMLMGTAGVIVMRYFYRRPQIRWFALFTGFVMVLMAIMGLDMLLRLSYPKQ